jgi:hypothetical protein
MRTAKVANDLRDLVPIFMDNRRKEYDALKAAAASTDFEQLFVLGMRMKGVGGSYGFHHITSIGIAIADSAIKRNSDSIARRILEYGEYLSTVQITYE